MVALLHRQLRPYEGGIDTHSAPFIIKSLKLLPLPVCAALPPKAMEIAVRIADLPPIDQLNSARQVVNTHFRYVQRGSSSFPRNLQSNVDDT